MSDSKAPKRSARRRWPWIAGGLVVIAATLALVLPRLLDLERYRPQLEAALSEATGWRVELGRLDYSWLDGMVLTIDPVTLSDPAGESTIVIESIHIVAGLAALFRGAIEVRDISVIRPEIRLVKIAGQESWPLPGTGGGHGDGASSETAREPSPLQVSITQIGLRDGRVSLEDRTTSPATSFSIESIDADLNLETLAVKLSGALADQGGKFSGGGTLEDDGLRLQFEDVRTEALQPLLGQDLLRAGGLINGEVLVGFPLRIQADLHASDLLLMTGEQALEQSDIELEIVPVGETLSLKSFSLTSGGTVLRGDGLLTPALDLGFRLEDAPIEEVVRAARAVFPFPLEFETPGRGSATARVRTGAQGATEVEAEGTLSSAGFELADYLPKARDLKASFRLNRAGDLVVKLLDGNIAGGPLRGTARLDSVDPPGTLAFDGSLQETPLGALLGGFLKQAEQTVQGPSALQAGLRLDLSRPEIDFRSLGGSLALNSTDVTLPGWDLEQAVAKELRKRIGSYTEIAKRLDPKIAAKLDELEQRASAGAGEGAGKVAEILRKLDVQVGFDSIPWKLDRLAFDGDAFQAEGSGSFSPEDGGVNLRMTARFSPEKTIELVAKYDALGSLVKDGRLSLPMLVEGPLTAPAIGVDLSGVLEGWVGIDTSKPKDAVKGLLKGLLEKELNKRKESKPPASKENDPLP